MVWQEKPKENREYKGEQRDDKKRRNMLTRMLHSVKGGSKKNKAAERPNKQIFLSPRETKKFAWELLTFKLTRKNREQKCKTLMPMANTSCTRHELSLPGATCCSEISANDAVGSAEAHLEFTTEMSLCHLKDPALTLGIVQFCCPHVSAWSCLSG